MPVYIVLYCLSYFAAEFGQYFLSGAALILAALYLFYRESIRSKRLLNLRGLFSLGFVGGQGVSCLKLSHLQRDWSIYTWICLFTAYLIFYISFELGLIFGGAKEKKELRGLSYTASGMDGKKKLYYAAIALFLISAAAFVTEAVWLGYVPLFVQGVPHAYSAFHISGIHYFTVSSVLVPSVAMACSMSAGKTDSRMALHLMIVSALALLIPILCVSRFQFTFAVLLVLFTLLVIKRNVPLWSVVLPAFLILPVYVVLTMARSHDVPYLQSIFEMRYDLPIYISQPYIYVANNYDNFNALVEALENHSYGLRMLFPFFALTGLKFVYPALVDFPIYVTKTELTTVTLFYDAFYDFGVLGIAAFSTLLGILCAKLENIIDHVKNPVIFVIYGQLAIYMLFSFFTTWFSNPTTWFYLAVCLLLAWIVREK